MGLRTFTLESGSAISRGAHPSLDAAWDHVAGAGSRPILMDVRLDGDDVPAGILDVLHRERPHPALVWITARLLYQLPPTQRALACPRGELADGCPLLLMPSPRSDPAGILRPLVVDRLLRLDPLDPGDPVPTRVARALGTDRRAGLLRLLRRTAERLRRGSGLGAASLRAFEDWVGRRTAELGFRMSREEVREFLPGTPPGKKAPPTPEPLRGEDSGSVAHLARLLAGRGDRPLRGLPGFSARARHAFEREGFVRVSELARLPEAVILGWPKVGEGTVTGMADALVLAVTGVVAEARRASSREAWKAALERPLLEHLEEFVRDASGRDRDILGRRTFARGRAENLRQLAKRCRISHERVRQIEDGLLLELERRLPLADVADERIEERRAWRSKPLPIAVLSSLDPWFAGTEEDAERLERILISLRSRHAVARAPDTDEPFVTARAARDLDALVSRSREAIRENPESTRPDEAVRRVVTEAGAPELVSLVRGLLGDVVAAGDGVLFRPSRFVRIRLLLEAAKAPMTVDELREALREQGVSASREGVRADLTSRGIPRVSPSTYYLPSGNEDWLVFLPDCERDVGAILAADPERQWSVEDIRDMLLSCGVEWIDAVETEALTSLLAMGECARYLGRGLWGLDREGETRRIRIMDAARSILRTNGGPMRERDLKREIATLRSIGKAALPLRWPVVRIGRGQVALGDEHLGLTEDRLAALREGAREHVWRSGGHLDDGAFRSLVERHCPDADVLDVPRPRVLLRLPAPPLASPNPGKR